MGCCTSSVRTTEPLPPSAGVRVIHLNGHVEELHGPAVVTARDATSGQPEDAVLLRATTDLQSASSATPLPPDAPLQADTLYLLLPRSVLASAGSSPAELAALTKRLQEVAVDEATFVEHRQVGGTAGGPSGGAPPQGYGDQGKGAAAGWRPALEDVIEENKSVASGGGDSERKLVETSGRS